MYTLLCMSDDRFNYFHLHSKLQISRHLETYRIMLNSFNSILILHESLDSLVFKIAQPLSFLLDLLLPFHVMQHVLLLNCLILYICAVDGADCVYFPVWEDISGRLCALSEILHNVPAFVFTRACLSKHKMNWACLLKFCLLRKLYLFCALYYGIWCLTQWTWICDLPLFLLYTLDNRSSILDSWSCVLMRLNNSINIYYYPNIFLGKHMWW